MAQAIAADCAWHSPIVPAKPLPELLDNSNASPQRHRLIATCRLFFFALSPPSRLRRRNAFENVLHRLCGTKRSSAITVWNVTSNIIMPLRQPTRIRRRAIGIFIATPSRG